MSYNGTNGLGCPGSGGCGCSGAVNGMGAYFVGQPRRGGLRGFGAESLASTFSASAVWADVVAGSTKNETTGQYNNAAGSRAAKAIQAGLSELGYGPIAPTGSFDAATLAAWKNFKSTNGLPAGVGNVQQDGLVLMEVQLKAGKVTGSSPPVVWVVDPATGQYIKEDSLTTKKAGIGMGMMLLLGAVVVGGVVLYAKKKKKSQQTTTMRVGSRDMDSYGGRGMYASVKE